MDERTIKPSMNVMQVVGVFKELNLKYDPTLVKKSDPRIKGAFVKVDFRNPSMTIESGGKDYGIEFYPIYTKRVKDGKLEDNPQFKQIKTIVDSYKSGETRVRANGRFSENVYASKDAQTGEYTVKSGTRILVPFSVSSNNVADEDSADGQLTGGIRSIKQGANANGETGRLNVEFYYIENSQTSDITAVPIQLVVPQDIADDFENLYSAGDCVRLDICLSARTVGTQHKSKRAFGNRESNVVEGYTVTEFVVFGGDEPLDEDSEYYVSTDEMKKLMSDRKIMEEALITDAKQKDANGGTEKKRGGIGNRASKMTDDSDDPFVDAGDSEEDSPF